jgi:hypothetical protein
MLVEVICLIGLLQSKNRPGAHLAGIPLQSLFWVGLVTGFVIWLIGTIGQMRLARIPARSRSEES